MISPLCDIPNISKVYIYMYIVYNIIINTSIYIYVYILHMCVRHVCMCNIVLYMSHVSGFFCAIHLSCVVRVTATSNESKEN